MKVKSIQEAWNTADELFPTDYIKDEDASQRAGYDIYSSTADGVYAHISDLGSRLEVNLPDGRTVNIWIEEEPQFTEGALAEALAIINEAVYQIEDNIHPKLQKATGLDEARNLIYSAYAKIAEILKEQHPDSKLYRRYNLQDA